MRLMDKARNGGKSPADLPAPAKGNKVYYDDQITGLGVRVTAAGARSFILNYWIKGRERRITIGSWPAFSVAAAREAAKELRQKIAKGDDPLDQRIEERGAPIVADLVDRYVEQHLPRKRPDAAADDQRMLRDYVLPTLGAVKVADVGHGEIDKLHRKITKAGKPYRANRTVALLSKMFSLAIKWKMRADNPAKGIERNAEQPRERYLSDSEIEALKRALVAHADRQAADVIWLLVLTGARKGEVLSMKWADLDLVVGSWTKPASTTKQKRTHRVPLSPNALELLAAIKRDAEPDAEYVFPGRKGGHRTDLKHSWETIRDAAGIGDVRLHDLRHNFASMLASSGLTLPVIGGLLGHSNVATTQRYAHLTDEAMRNATNIVGQRLTRE
jgi:integrase